MINKIIDMLCSNNATVAFWFLERDIKRIQKAIDKGFYKSPYSKEQSYKIANQIVWNNSDKVVDALNNIE